MRGSLGAFTAAASLLVATAALAATVTYNTVLPTLAFSAPGYTPNGSITATVANVAGCTNGTFTVNASPVAGSGPSGSTPPATNITTYIGFPAGNFAFNGVGYGNYTITTTTTACAAGAPPAPTSNVVTVAVPVPVPTLSEWAMILFGLVLAGGAALYVQRRRMVA